MDCPQTENLSQPGFFERIKASGKRIPLAGSLEVTFHCNLRCVHCYVGDHRKGVPQVQELTTREILHILDQVADAGTLWFLLTGGEPLLRPDLMDICTHAIRRGLLLTLFTNGTLLTPSIADQLGNFPPQFIEITLYGATRETYESVTGIPGSYKRCLQGIDLLLQRGLPLKLKTMAIRQNLHELEAMKAFAKNLGVDFRYDPLLVGSLDNKTDLMAQRLSPEEVVQIDTADPARLAEWQDVFRKKKDGEVDRTKVYVCGAGKNTFHIDPFGRLYPCMLSRSQWYNLREGTFFDGWTLYIDQVISQPIKAARVCTTCSLMILCGHCPGKASLEGRQIDDRVDYFCQIGRLRYHAFRNSI